MKILTEQHTWILWRAQKRTRVLWRLPFLNSLSRLWSFSLVVIRVFLSRNDKNKETPSALLLTLSSAFTTNIQRISFHIMKPVLFVEPRSARARRPPPLASLHIPLNKLTVSVRLSHQLAPLPLLKPRPRRQDSTCCHLPDRLGCRSLWFLS